MPELFDKVKQEGAQTLASLRLRLETEEVLDWDFEFWDVDDKRRIRKKVERLNDVSGDVYVICTTSPESDVAKRRCLQNGSHVQGEPLLTTTDRDFVACNEAGGLETLKLVGSSRGSGMSAATTVNNDDSGVALRSRLIPPEAMDLYHVHVEKLRRDLKDCDLDDHKWELRSFDQDGMGIAKLYCCECQKET